MSNVPEGQRGEDQTLVGTACLLPDRLVGRGWRGKLLHSPVPRPEGTSLARLWFEDEGTRSVRKTGALGSGTAGLVPVPSLPDEPLRSLTGLPFFICGRGVPRSVATQLSRCSINVGPAFLFWGVVDQRPRPRGGATH